MRITSASVASIIDESPISRMQIATMVLCGAVAVLDGFDTQAIAFVAPVIARDWGLDSANFGPVFGAGLLGLTLGALVFGPIADRFGRRRVIIWSTVMFGVFSGLTPLAHTTLGLIAMRFLTGLGLGGAMPNIIALTSEYSPQRRRATLVTLMFCGFPLGAVMGGLVSAPLMQRFGWPAVFYAGGLLPLLLAPVLYGLLPESIKYLSATGARRAALSSTLSRIVPNAQVEFVDGLQVVEPAKQTIGTLVPALFRDGRGPGTILLWVVFFVNLLILYFLINWLPVLLQDAGLPIERAVVGVAALNAGGIVGGLTLGWICDRTSPTRVLPISYALAAALVTALGIAPPANVGLTMTLIFLSGLFVIGSQFCMNALAAGLYPTTIRSTGVGWALGVGRVGSVIGPVVGGIFIGWGWSTSQILLAAALPALLAAICVFLLGASRPRPVSVAPGVAH